MHMNTYTYLLVLIDGTRLPLFGQIQIQSHDFFMVECSHFGRVLCTGSKRLTKGNVMSASMPTMEPFTAIISGSKVPGGGLP